MEWLTTILGWLNPKSIIEKWLEGKKQSKKLTIYDALKQTGLTPPSLNLEQLSERTGIPVKKLTPLLYELIKERIINEGPFAGTNTRYPYDDRGNPYR